ncbi:hypothetical protein ACYF6T_14410 [Streptomyces sp. 7R007]
MPVCPEETPRVLAVPAVWYLVAGGAFRFVAASAGREHGDRLPAQSAAVLVVPAGALCPRRPLRSVGVLWPAGGLTAYTAPAVRDLPHLGFVPGGAALVRVAGIAVRSFPPSAPAPWRGCSGCGPALRAALRGAPAATSGGLAGPRRPTAVPQTPRRWTPSPRPASSGTHPAGGTMAPSKISAPPAGAGTADTAHVLTAAEHAEYQRLRRAATVRHRRLRRAAATLLLLLTMLLTPLAVVAAWVHDEVVDTDRYVQTVAPLAADPAVQNVVIDRLTRRVVSQIDVDALTASLTRTLEDSGAPPRVVAGSTALAGPLRSAVTSVVHRNVSRVITSDAFQQVWEGSNRRAHAAVVRMLTGDGSGALRAQGDSVQLNLGPVVDQVRQRLVDAGFEKAAAIPDSDRTITLFRTEQLGRAQDGMRLLDIVGTWLPVLTVAVAACAVWTAPAHRLMLLITASGIGVMAVVLLVALAVVRRVYLDAVPSDTLPTDAAAAIYDTFVRFLRDSTRTLLVVAVITALAAWLYGPGRVARRLRSLAGRATTATGRALGRRGVHTGGGGRWLDAHRSWTTGVVIGAGALSLVLWNHPTVGGVVLVLCLVLGTLFALQVAASAADRAPGAPPGLTRPG